MGDSDWDDDSPQNTFSTGNAKGVNEDEGRMFSRGRGFSVAKNNHANKFDVGSSDFGGGGDGAGGWEDKPSSFDQGWNDNTNGEEQSFGDRRGRGRGRGGRGGGRGRGGGGRSYNNSNDDDEEERFESRRGGRGGGRGGRGGGRGGGRSNRDDDDNNDNFATNGKTEEDQKKKERYIPPDPTQDEEEIFASGISSGCNFFKYNNIDVNISGENVPNPISSFEQAGLRSLLLENIKKSGYTTPTPIQKHALPIIMQGRDIMASAQTGSGKTAAFLLPIIHCLLADPSEAGPGECAQPQAIIVSPTRELAIQIKEEARKFAYSSILKTVVAYGGTAVFHQKNRLLEGCNILVATPGRLNDFVKRGLISFDLVRYFVLDEADRMLDMGFLPCVEEMMDHQSMVKTGDRQTLMFSATFPEEIQRLAAKFLHNYVFVSVGIVGSACDDVDQTIYEVEKFKKRQKLVDVINEAPNERILVFVETKRNADFIATFLCESDIPTTSIHGDRLQREREEALRDFKTGKRNVLVATGVAARGLDIKGVHHVINFDLPKSIDEYVHRIGRTGRVGNKGKATSFFDASQDGQLSGDLARILKQANQEVPPFLKGGSGSYSSSKFGGTDIRQGAVEVNEYEGAEEEW